MSTFKFCLPALIGTQNKTNFPNAMMHLILRAELAVHSHPSPFLKKSKWHFLTHACNQKNNFGSNYFFWCALKVPQVTLSKTCHRLRPSAQNQWMNWIISKMHHSIWKILFASGANEYLERLEGKIWKCF
jgi:hypothetical protein